MEIGFLRSRDSSDRPKRACYRTKPNGLCHLHARGACLFHPDRRRAENAENVQECADLLNTVVAYIGTYRLEGDEWITKVDVAWNPEWIGTEQKRFFKVEGNRLQVLTPWGVHSNWPEKGMTPRIVTFEKVK
jgi:Lipocalin-like domain